MDLVKWYSFTTFDISGKLGFGEPFGCLGNGTYRSWVASIFSHFKTGVFLVAVRFYLPVTKILILVDNTNGLYTGVLLTSAPQTLLSLSDGCRQQLLNPYLLTSTMSATRCETSPWVLGTASAKTWRGRRCAAKRQDKAR